MAALVAFALPPPHAAAAAHWAGEQRMLAHCCCAGDPTTLTCLAARKRLQAGPRCERRGRRGRARVLVAMENVWHEDMEFGSEDEHYVRDDAGRNPPPGFEHFYDRHHRIHATPLPSQPDNAHMAAATEAWEVILGRVRDERLRRLDQGESATIDGNFLTALEYAADAAVQRARYSDAEWAEHVDGVRNLRFDWYFYESHTEPIYYEEYTIVESRGAKVLWHFLRVHAKRLIRVRRLLFAWYAPHCGNPKHLDFEAERAAAMGEGESGEESE